MLPVPVLLSNEPPKLAVVARFYHPYPDKRTSYFRLYALDWQGKQRKLLSLPGQRCTKVMWAGRNRLVYEVYLGSAETSASVWTVTLNGQKPKLLTNSAYIDKEKAFAVCADGVPAIHHFRRRRNYEVTPQGKLIPLKQNSNGWFDPFLRKDGKFKPNRVASTDERYPGIVSVGNDYNASIETTGSRSDADGMFLSGVHHPKTNRLWLYDYPGMHSERLWRVRWEKAKIEELFWTGRLIDWRPDRAHVAYATQRDLSKYGPKKVVWTHELWVGELESGAKRRIDVPIALINDVAVSPH